MASADTTALIEEARHLASSAIRTVNRNTYTALADALEAEHKMRRDYENAICWDTTCLNCSKLLDRSYADYVRADQAEAELRRLREGVARLLVELVRNEDGTGMVFIEPAVQRLRSLLGDTDA